MNYRLLEVFAAVCECGGVTRAADTLFMTQPAVTNAIRRLEAETGLVLFDRLSRRLHLTEAGQWYLDKALQLLELSRELEQGVAEAGKRTTLRIGSCITIACFSLPEILRDFEQRHCGEVNVEVGSASAVLDLLAGNDIDLALYEGPAPPLPYTSLPFSSYRIIPVCSPNHPSAGCAPVSIDDLLRQRLLLREEGSAVRDVFDSFLRLRQLKATPFVTSVNTQAILRLVKQGLGVGIVPGPTVANDIKDGELVEVRVKGMHLANENRIVHHQDKHVGDAMAQFMDCVHRSRKKL